MSRRHLAPLALLLAGALVACSNSTPAPATQVIPKTESEIVSAIDTAKVRKTLTVGVDNPHYLFHHDVLVALDRGYFKEVGIDNVTIVTTEDPLPGLIGGSLDLALYDTDTTIAAGVKSRTQLRMLSIYLGGEANILGVRQGINTPQDLRGKTITGGQFGSRNDFLVRKLIRDAGMNPDTDVKIVSTGGQSNSRLQAILSGTVDGAGIQLRHKGMLEAQGGKFLLQETAQVPQVGWSAGKLLAESPETVAAFLQATLKARQFIVDPQNKDAVLNLMAAKGFQIPQEFKDAYADENAPDYHTRDGGFETADMDKFVTDQINFKVVPSGTNWRQWVDLMPLWRAQKALGLPLRPAIGGFQ
ncbi:ABC transporter substrate-binding protein [Kibdelosporangium aridum]|uniref:NMT1/THI5 like n=2 Tax=Kibdelosporangium aridum TaxID=2030 RepID=A0A1W2FIG5_KIBAR|nr:ABC transporter substrate-binding protein [Kibdelosporangium aridum]SMD21462.1 NMT1/THI5 like [Kibdelosporangium aridum]